MDQNDLQQTDNTTPSTAAEPAFTPPASFNPFPPADTNTDSVTNTTAVTEDASTAPALAVPADDSTATSPVITDDADSTPPVTGDLLDIKQGALAKLGPLVEHLDQTPEEKFRTTMMLIQATDDQSKIKDAYAAAQEITDQKAQAQALLDVVNEINYFTQQQKEA